MTLASRTCGPRCDKPMSYILDALKRADAERERGVVPGLYARQVTTLSGKSAAPARRPIWLALVLVLTVGGIGAGVALWRTPTETPRQVLPDPPVARLAAPASLPPSAPASIRQSQTPVASPIEVPASPPVSSTPTPVTAAASARTAPTSAPSATSKPPASATPAITLPLLGDLSEDLRRQIPALNISGAVYSENPGQRLLLVNNQVLNQGSQAAPEVSLDEIGAKSSTFSFRGTRFRLAY